MPEYVLPIVSENSRIYFDRLDDFTKGYVEAMFFTSDTDGDLYSDRAAEFDDLSVDALVKINNDCATFQLDLEVTLKTLTTEYYGYDMMQAGRDFWYSRNEHGTGFWDRDANVEMLDKCHDHAVKKFGAIQLYPGDDTKLYLE